MKTESNIAVVIPCYKAKAHVIDVINNIPAFVEKIYCIDDACPETTGKYIEDNSKNLRVRSSIMKKILASVVQ